ncbi:MULTISPECIES: flagellar biosynthesis anti-sigma factor FlgM [Methylotenera]|uniref:flagellar biosynthesis anti-sigma factor FlgM n=1 Tax=Methylotenera TaxID=359407 RepID=UPI00038134E2|nr:MULTISPECIES: flagellar biosynthesis anti-sigma factor FlgM [Methylotenera]
MKINDSVQKSLVLGTDKSDNKAAKKPDTATPAKASGTVTLSPMSTKLQSLEAKVAADNVYDAEKVESIKLAIKNGQFNVSAEKVADGLINSVKDFLQANR